MKSARHKTICLGLLAVLAIGCESNHYQIELTPKEKSIHRQLTCWRERKTQEETTIAPFPRDELERIAAVYHVPVPASLTKKHQFSAEFAAQLPDDVGGRGSYTHWDTPLGSLSSYVERFRGNDNLVPEIENRQQAADRITDLLIGWLASELQDEAGFPALHEFLEQGFRQDLKNLGLYGWAYDILSEYFDDALEECLIRVGQYLSEREYFSPEQLPLLTRALQDLDNEGPAKLLAVIQRLIASKMGVGEDQAIPDSLRFLANLSALEASSSNYLRGTDEFKGLLESWESERASNPDAEEPKPYEVFDELVSEAFLANVELFGGGTDQLSVRLNVPTAPFLANGAWDEKASQLSWSRDIVAADSDRTEFPNLLYAFWSIPNETEQKARFGRIVLAGKTLGTYCLWYRGLSAKEAGQWDDFVTSLRPGDDLLDQLRVFRFSHERSQAKDDQRDLASTPRDLILSALTDGMASERDSDAAK